ncbi:hypothetical protein MP638_007029 [Amoeboaphelidium occidentale]|nr:hypothetical protein MP638_007029 [Amoeboaphelidium occidentale]
MSEMPTKEGLHSLFTHYGMKEKADLLKETPDSFVWMKLLPEQEWMKIAGKDSGSVIYNYLHPDQGSLQPIVSNTNWGSGNTDWSFDFVTLQQLLTWVFLPSISTKSSTSSCNLSKEESALTESCYGKTSIPSSPGVSESIDARKKPPQKAFMMHANESAHDVARAHGEGEIINWKSVAERFFRNNYIFAEFFYYNARNKLKRPKLYFEPSNELELEQLDCVIGNVFAYAPNDIWTPSVLTTIASLRVIVSKLRHENPGLV